MTRLSFGGFPDTKRAFWKALARNGNREWFQANKERYERDWAAPMLELLTLLREAIDADYPYCDLDEPKVFRIHRDVRFGTDKTPFKDHIAGRIPVKRSGGVLETPLALYLHLGAECFAAAGQYVIPPEQLGRVREAIVDPVRGKELAAILAKLDKRGFTLGAKERLARVPRGFPADHPRAELLKLKGLMMRFPPMPPFGGTSGKDLVRWLRAESKAVAALVEWTTRASA
jgi:uncharacterized protein (TIGR02453 family)